MNYYQRVSLFLALLLVMLAAPLQKSPRIWASSYSCDPSHCYGQVYWNTGGEYSQAFTDNILAHLTVPSGTLAHINNELWLVDLAGPDVEVGTKIGAGITINCGAQCFFSGTAKRS